MSRGGLPCLVLVLAACVAAPSVAKDRFCEAFQTVVIPGKLYAVPSGCGEAGCLTVLDGRTNSLPRDSYRFLYVTNPSTTRNGLLVLQRKYTLEDSDKGADRALVRRERVPFACAGAEPGPTPDVDDDDEDAPERFASLSYDEYDRTIRNGYGTSAEARYIDRQFHVIYDNGVDRQCVSTRDPERRPWLLFEGRERVPGPFRALLARIFGSSAAVADAARYDEVRLNVYAYEKKPDEDRCLSFSVDETFSLVSVGIYDVEDLVKRRRFFGGLPRIDWDVKFVDAD